MRHRSFHESGHFRGHFRGSGRDRFGQQRLDVAILVFALSRVRRVPISGL
jgi:hypothetical protein